MVLLIASDMRCLPVLALLAACNSSPATTDGGPTPDRPDANPVPAGPAAIEVGSLDATGAFSPYVAEQDAPLIWGAQGGIMITPTIRLDPAEGWRAGTTYQVTLTHSAAPGHEAAFRIANPTYRFIVRVDADQMPAPPGSGGIPTPELDMIDGYLALPRIFNQLEGAVHDSWTHLDVRVESEGRVGTESTTLHLLDATVRGPACDVYEVVFIGGPCRARYVPFTAEIVAIEPGMMNYDGTTTAVVRYTTRAEGNAAECAPELADGEGTRVFLESAVDAAGITVGAEVEMYRMLPVGSSCGFGDVLPDERRGS